MAKKRLLKEVAFLSDNKIRLLFSEKITLSLSDAADSDKLLILKKGTTTCIVTAIENGDGTADEHKTWVVTYSGTSLKKTKGAAIDDEVVVVIETKEVFGMSKKATKSATKKKVTKSADAKKTTKKKKSKSKKK